jgi:putative oxygen-independent coproporphyrinogen III oxidase
MSAVSLQAPAKEGAWLEDPGFGAYVHVPFCVHRCHYCDFNTYEGQEELHQSYVDALVTHIDSLPGELPQATSVFFGGGTPTILDPKELGRVLDALRQRIGITPGTEITIEANPETVDEARFEALLVAGFNRVSVGVQSLVPRVLMGLGRAHSPEVALRALAAARRAGFREINADLIYGSPWERPEDWRRSLKGVIAAGTDHVSAYALTVEEGTPLGTLVGTGRVPDVDPDVQADRYEVARDLLGAAGFERYEISNWARPGLASAHNVLYWSAGEYLGLGAGAHGHLAGRRHWAVRLPRAFIEAVASGATVEAGSETLSASERAAEGLMLGLRLTSGIHELGFTRRFGSRVLGDKAAGVGRLVAARLLERESAYLRVPEDQTFRADAVIRALL